MRMGGNNRDGRFDSGIPYRPRHVLAIDSNIVETTISCRRWCDIDVLRISEIRQCLAVREIDTDPKRGEGHGTVERSGVKQHRVQAVGEVASDAALSDCCRTVDRHDAAMVR